MGVSRDLRTPWSWGSDRPGGSPRPLSRAGAARDPLAALRNAMIRYGSPGVPTLVVGLAALWTGLLVGNVVAAVVGGGVVAYGLYLRVVPPS